MLLHYITTLILDHQQFSVFNLRSLIILCLSSEGINLSLITSSSFVFELFCGKFFEALAILSAILFPIKSPVVSAVFESLFLNQF